MVDEVDTIAKPQSRRSLLRFFALSAAAGVPAVAALASAPTAKAWQPCSGSYITQCTGCTSGCFPHCQKGWYDSFDISILCFTTCDYACDPCHTNC
jgi:hypothetical protein